MQVTSVSLWLILYSLQGASYRELPRGGGWVAYDLLHRLVRACLRSESGQLCVLPPVPYDRLRDWPHTVEPHIQNTRNRHADAIRAGCARCATFPLLDMTEEIAIHCLHHSAMDMALRRHRGRAVRRMSAVCRTRLVTPQMTLTPRSGLAAAMAFLWTAPDGTRLLRPGDAAPHAPYWPVDTTLTSGRTSVPHRCEWMGAPQGSRAPAGSSTPSRRTSSSRPYVPAP